MWNFLVDCFAGEEDFQSDILSKTFRCPQVLTNRLSAELPSENWLGEIIYNRRHFGTNKRREGPSRQSLREETRNLFAERTFTLRLSIT
jgi:hypothetical protein